MPKLGGSLWGTVGIDDSIARVVTLRLLFHMGNSNNDANGGIIVTIKYAFMQNAYNNEILMLAP